MELQIRWMKRSDLSKVRYIQNVTDPTLPDNFVEENLNNSRNIGLVARNKENILGFAFYEVGKSIIDLTYLAVDPAFRRKGIGGSIMEHLVTKLNSRRTQISVSVSEYNLDMHLFLRKIGFKAVSVLKNTQDSEYKFLYEIVQPEFMGC